MAFTFETTRVQRPFSPPTTSDGTGSLLFAHRRANLDGQHSLWRLGATTTALPATLTPESYADFYLRDEFLVSNDSGVTWRQVTASASHKGPLAVPAFDNAWSTTVDSDNQESFLNSVSLGVFSASQNPARTFYLVNQGGSVGSLSFNLIDVVTESLATQYSGQVQISIDGLFQVAGNGNPDSTYNASKVWATPPQSTNAYRVALGTDSYLKVTLTLVNFPQGGVADSSVEFGLEVISNPDRFPIGLDHVWLQGSRLVDNQAGFEASIVSTPGTNQIQIEPFAVNIQGAAYYQSTTQTLTTTVTGTYRLQATSEYTTQLVLDSDALPTNAVSLATFDFDGTTITNLAYIAPIRATEYAKLNDATIARARFISVNASGEPTLATDTSEVVGVSLYPDQGYYAPSGLVWLESAEAIAVGDFLSPNASGKAVTTTAGVAYALEATSATDQIFLAQLTGASGGGGGGGGASAASQVTVDTTALQVINGPTQLQEFVEANDIALLNARNTGLLYGGDLSINVSGTTVDITAGAGQILDNTLPEAPVYQSVEWTAKSNLALDSVTPTVTYFYVDDNTDTIKQTTAAPTIQQRRTRIYLGRSIWSAANSAIVAVANDRDWTQQISAQLRDLSAVIGLAKVSGLGIQPNADLTFVKNTGVLFDFGAGNALNPHTVSFPASNPATFQYVLSDAPTGTDRTTIDPDNFEPTPGGGLSTPAINRYTVQPVFLFQSGNIRLQYGQNDYLTIDQALTGISEDAFVANANLSLGLRIGYIIVQRGATDLSDPGQALFISTNKFGEIGGGVAIAQPGTPGATALDELSDVDLTVPPTDGQILKFESASGTFKPAADNASAGGAGGWTKIDETILASPAASVNFPSINQTYTHLKVIARAQSDFGANTIDSLSLEVNSTASTGSNYFSQYDSLRNITRTAGERSDAILFENVATPSAEVAFSPIELLIDFYSLSDNFPFVKGDCKTYRTTSDMHHVRVDFVHRVNTNVTALTFAPVSGTNFSTGTRFELWAI